MEKELVTIARDDGTMRYGVVLHKHRVGRTDGFVCDWYYTPDRKGQVFQMWVPADKLNFEEVR